MALTPLQRRICLLLAEQRKRSGESYVAGGVALNELAGGTRRSRDIDLFHDTEAALAASWAADREALASAGLSVTARRVAPSFVQGEVGDGTETEILQWVQDSAFRYFPLVEDAVFGLTLHPVDHATNKVLALAGRRVARDWIDAITCHERIQPLGYLAWAAAGKDPGLSPVHIIEQAARTRYAQRELDVLDFEGAVPDAAELSRRWHRAVEEAREIVRVLPAEQAGKCVLDPEGGLQRAAPGALAAELAAERVSYREGSIRGVLPEFIGAAKR